VTEKTRLLIVDDDESLAKVVSNYLSFEGFEVAWAADGNAALEFVKNSAPEVILLDVMLPDRDGFEWIGLLRQFRGTPVVMLTARGLKAERLRGLNLGADDYITKPFDLEELVARIRVVVRRSRPSVESLKLGAISVDFRFMTARNGVRPLHLTHREFQLLRYLAERQNRVVHRDELLREVWGFPQLPYTRSVDHAIARLRKKLERDPHHPRYIHTVHGNGYCLTP